MTHWWKILPLLILWGLSTLVWAESTIAVLDVDRALTRSALADSYREKVQKDFAPDEARLKSLSEEGNALQERLRKEGDFLSESGKQALVEQVKAKYEQFQQLGRNLERLKQQREQEFLEEVRPKLDKVLKALVKERELAMIVDRRSLVFADKALDITDLVIERLNQQ